MAMLADRAWLWLATACYAAAFVSATVSMLRSHTRSRTLMLSLVLTGLCLQSIGLYLRGMQFGGCPVRNTFEVVQFVIWSVTILYLVVGAAFRLSLLGYFTSGLALVMSIVSLSVPRWDATTGPAIFGGEPWIEMHASLGLFAYGAFGTLALTSLMFLLQTFSLKRKHLHGLFAFLPSIVALEQMNLRLLLTGLSVLSISILAGGHYFHQNPDSITGAKLLASVAIWLAYSVVLVLRLRRVLVAGSLAWTCLALFGLALVSLGPISRHAPPEGADAPAHASLRPRSLSQWDDALLANSESCTGGATLAEGRERRARRAQRYPFRFFPSGAKLPLRLGLLGNSGLCTGGATLAEGRENRRAPTSPSGLRRDESAIPAPPIRFLPVGGKACLAGESALQQSAVLPVARPPRGNPWATRRPSKSAKREASALASGPPEMEVTG